MRKKIPLKYSSILTSFVLSVIMTLFISGILIFLNESFINEIFTHWMKAWFRAFCAAFPLLLIVRPVVHKVMTKITE